jgi:pheromone shutdown protein TraB
MSLVPTSVLYSSPGVPLWQDAAAAVNSSNLSWVAYSGTQGLSNAYIATLSNSYTQGLTTTSVILANVKSGLSNDAANSWLVASGCFASNTVSFIAAAQPTAPTAFTVSWAVASY